MSTPNKNSFVNNVSKSLAKSSLLNISKIKSLLPLNMSRINKNDLFAFINNHKVTKKTALELILFIFLIVITIYNMHCNYLLECDLTKQKEIQEKLVDLVENSNNIIKNLNETINKMSENINESSSIDDSKSKSDTVSVSKFLNMNTLKVCAIISIGCFACYYIAGCLDYEIFNTVSTFFHKYDTLNLLDSLKSTTEIVFKDEYNQMFKVTMIGKCLVSIAVKSNDSEQYESLSLHINGLKEAIKILDEQLEGANKDALTAFITNSTKVPTKKYTSEILDLVFKRS